MPSNNLLSLFFKNKTAMKGFCVLSIPLLFSFGLALLFYPGFMSYDTLHALRGARNGVTDSMWPPMVSYVWRIIDRISNNPSAMHFSQIFLLLLSIFSIVVMITKKITTATVCLIIYLSIPAILGTLAVIWKDVLMAGFLLSSFALILCIRHIKHPTMIIFLSLLTLFLLFLGVCSRHNAIFAAVPLIFFLAWTLCLFSATRYITLSTLLLGLTLTGTIFFTKIQLDHYSLPTFVRLNSSQETFILTVRVLDIAGASVCLGRSLFTSIDPTLSVVEIKRLYDPRHINLSLGLLNKIHIDSRITQIWLSTAVHHPLCFFSHKAHLSKYLLGFNHGDQFLITAPSIDKNEYGYELADSSLRESIVTYIRTASQYSYLKPWFLYGMALALLIYRSWKKTRTIEEDVLVLSAFLYLMSLIVFGNAADARLVFYTTTTLSIVIFISMKSMINWISK
jgi:hypothetical protein